jgi:hypothetical protein
MARSETERTIPGDLQDVLRKPPCDLYRGGEDLILVLSEIVSLPRINRNHPDQYCTVEGVGKMATVWPHPNTANNVRRASGSVGSHLFSPAPW